MQKKTGIERILYAARYSCEGLVAAFKGEAAFRQEVLLAIVLLPLALLLPVHGLSKALLVGSVFLLLIVELLNSAVEAAIDRISDEIHPLSKNAKDFGSAAVFLSIANLVVTWALVLFF